MMRGVQSFFSLARDVFPYALIFYLVLFLLENLFPGFVSNNFNLNWVLGAVLALGLLAAFAPERKEEREESPIGRNDYFLMAGLGFIGGAIVFAKLDAGAVLRWITALVSGGLIVLMGFVVLTGKDEEIKEVPEIPAETRETVPFSHYLKRAMRPLLVRRVELPLAYVLVFAVFTAFLIPNHVATIANALRRPAPVPLAETPELISTAEPFFWDDMNEFVSIRPSDDLRISVLNGGGDLGAAATFSAVLADYGFGNVTAGNAQGFDYTNAQIRFKEADKPQANIIKQLLKRDYPVVVELPQESTTSGITVILGKKETTQ